MEDITAVWVQEFERAMDALQDDKTAYVYLTLKDLYQTLINRESVVMGANPGDEGVDR